MKKLTTTLLVALAMAMSLFNVSGTKVQAAGTAERTILLYDIGSNLETEYGMASYNLRQVMEATYDSDKIHFIVMTGGSKKWQLESEYLQDASGNAIAEISTDYNQVWEVSGMDASGNHGKMTLIDGDGVLGDGASAKLATSELMSDPKVLKAFIDYGKANFPAEKYDLILWDHGGGPNIGFGDDEHHKMTDAETYGEGYYDYMPLNEIVRAIKESSVDKFDFVDFDACIMSSLEIALAFEPYTDYLIVSPESEPGYGQEYTSWMNQLGDNPATDTVTLGKMIVDKMIAFYEDPASDGTGQKGTLAFIDEKAFVQQIAEPALELANVMCEEAEQNGAKSGILEFYDEYYTKQNTMEYGGGSFYLVDLGNFVDQLTLNLREVDNSENVKESTNGYLEVAEKIKQILKDEELIYAKATESMTKENPSGFTRNADGTIDFAGTQKPTGISLYFDPSLPMFIDAHGTGKPLAYKAVMDKIAADSSNQTVKAFVKQYERALADYCIIKASGYVIDQIGIAGHTGDVSYDDVMAYWKNYPNSEYEIKYWDGYISDCLTVKEGKEVTSEADLSAATKNWLQAVVTQQGKEYFSTDKVSVSKLKRSDGTGYHVAIDGVSNKIFDKIAREQKVSLNPAYKKKAGEILLQDFKENPMLQNASEEQLEEAVENTMKDMPWESVIKSDVAAQEYFYETFFTGTESYANYYKQDSSKWDFQSLQDTVYALSEKDGTKHLAKISSEDGGIVAMYDTGDEIGKLCLIVCDANEETGSFTPTGILFAEGSLDSGGKVIPLDMAQKSHPDLELTPADAANAMYFILKIPLSSSFKLGDLARIETVAISEVAADLDSETVAAGKYSFNEYAVEDIYGGKFDLTAKFNAADSSSAEVIDIRQAEVSSPSVAYTGEEVSISPVVTVDGKTLVEGTDYQLILAGDVSVGTYFFGVQGIGNYVDWIQGRYSITKGATTFTLSPAKTTVTLDGKSKTVAINVSGISIGSEAPSLSIKSVSNEQESKVALSGGKVTLKRGITNCVVKVNVTSAANANRKALTKTVTITVKKGATTFTVKPASKTFKASALKKKAQTVTLKVTGLSAGSTKPTFAVKSVTNGQKAKVTVSKSGGKVTLKKGIKKCTVKVSVTSAANASRKALTKTVTLTVK